MTDHETSTGCREVEAFRSASLSGPSIPPRVLVAPWGEVESSNGSFVVDEESVRLVIEAFKEHGTDLPIDYEHQTLGGAYASPSGQAPAAGWIRQITAEPGVGLLAEIEWTDQARKVLEAREYRYLSPVAFIRKTDRKLVALHSAALTNKPAIVGMKPLVHGAERLEESDDQHPLGQLRLELQLAKDTPAEEVLLVASQRLNQWRQASRDQHIKACVDRAVREGKLVEAQRTWAEALVAREESLFEQWLETAPVQIPHGVTAAPGSSSSSSSRRGKEQRARSEFRSNPLLARITSEDAYVSSAVVMS